MGTEGLTERKREPLEPRLVYSKVEAAEQLGISVRVLDRLVRDGELLSLKIGRRRLFARVDLEEYVERLRRDR